MPPHTSRVRYLLESFLLRLSSSKVIDGLWIGVSTSPATAIQQVNAALSLIKKYDPHRYKRIIDYLDRIWIRSLTGNIAQFNAHLNACEIDSRYLLEEDPPPAVIASIIVHEATHAWLEQRGIRYSEKLRQRIETVCIRQEQIFASKLPESERNNILDSRQLAIESLPDLRDTAFDARAAEGAVQTLQNLGTPRWIIRLAVAMHDLRSRIRRKTLKSPR